VSVYGPQSYEEFQVNAFGTINGRSTQRSADTASGVVAGLVIFLIIQVMGIFAMLACLCVRLFARVHPDPAHPPSTDTSPSQALDIWFAERMPIVASLLQFIFSCAFIAMVETQVKNKVYIPLDPGDRREDEATTGQKMWIAVCSLSVLLVAIEVLYLVKRKKALATPEAPARISLGVNRYGSMTPVLIAESKYATHYGSTD